MACSLVSGLSAEAWPAIAAATAPPVTLKAAAGPTSGASRPGRRRRAWLGRHSLAGPAAAAPLASRSVDSGATVTGGFRFVSGLRRVRLRRSPSPQLPRPRRPARRWSPAGPAARRGTVGDNLRCAAPRRRRRVGEERPPPGGDSGGSKIRRGVLQGRCRRPAAAGRSSRVSARLRGLPVHPRGIADFGSARRALSLSLSISLSLSDTSTPISVCVCVCVRARACACASACRRVCMRTCARA